MMLHKAQLRHSVLLGEIISEVVGFGLRDCVSISGRSTEHVQISTVYGV
jgi:hypothetical protein